MNWRRIHIDEIISVAILLFLVATVALQVFSRYVMGAAMPWTEEVARVQLIALTFFGTAIVARRGAHMAIVQFTEILPQRLTRGVRVIARLAEAVFYGFAAWLAWQMATFSMNRNLITVPVPRGVIYWMAVAALALAFVQVLVSLARDRGRSAPDDGAEQASD